MTSLERSSTWSTTVSKQLQTVTIEGKGPVTLRASDHIATGGEGSIYKIGNLAIKIYLDPKAMRAAGMPEKVKALTAIKHPYIVAPEGIVTDAAANPVGHFLPFVEKAHPL